MSTREGRDMIDQRNTAADITAETTWVGRQASNPHRRLRVVETPEPDATRVSVVHVGAGHERRSMPLVSTLLSDYRLATPEEPAGSTPIVAPPSPPLSAVEAPIPYQLAMHNQYELDEATDRLLGRIVTAQNRDLADLGLEVTGTGVIRALVMAESRRRWPVGPVGKGGQVALPFGGT